MVSKKKKYFQGLQGNVDCLKNILKYLTDLYDSLQRILKFLRKKIDILSKNSTKANLLKTGKIFKNFLDA